MADAIADIRVRLASLLSQESRNYRCPNYLEPSRNAASNLPASSLVSMLDECANLVADIPVESNHVESMTKSKSTASFTDVVQHQGNALSREASANSLESLTFWRQQMFDWACMVVDSFGANREVVAVSFNLLDRFVVAETSRKNASPIVREDFQLFSMTCLYIAVKILEPYPRKLGVEALVDMSRGYYTADDVTSTEMDILVSLKWYVNPPTVIRFCRLFGEMLPSEIMERIELPCTVMSEIAISDAAFLSYSPSTIGLVSLLLALRMDKNYDHANQLMIFAQDLVNVTSNEFQEAYLLLEKTYGA